MSSLPCHAAVVVLKTKKQGNTYQQIRNAPATKTTTNTVAKLQGCHRQGKDKSPKNSSYSTNMSKLLQHLDVKKKSNKQVTTTIHERTRTETQEFVWV